MSLPDLKLPECRRDRPYFANRMSNGDGCEPPTDDEDEFLRAVALFHTQNHRWPTVTQYLWIARKLGYTKRNEPQHAAGETGDPARPLSGAA